jgi:hypothetical protein
MKSLIKEIRSKSFIDANEGTVIPAFESVAKQPSIGFVIHFLLFSQDCLVKSFFSRLRFAGYDMH